MKIPEGYVQPYDSCQVCVLATFHNPQESPDDRRAYVMSFEKHDQICPSSPSFIVSRICCETGIAPQRFINLDEHIVNNGPHKDFVKHLRRKYGEGGAPGHEQDWLHWILTEVWQFEWIEGLAEVGVDTRYLYALHAQMGAYLLRREKKDT